MATTHISFDRCLSGSFNKKEPLVQPPFRRKYMRLGVFLEEKRSFQFALHNPDLDNLLLSQFNVTPVHARSGIWHDRAYSLDSVLRAKYVSELGVKPGQGFFSTM